MNLWINADIDVPINDETVLAIINGKCGDCLLESKERAGNEE